MKRTVHTLKITLTALALLVATTGCLDKYPGGAIPERDAMKSYSDAEQHLVGIYSSMLSSSLYSGLLTLLPDIQADLVYAVDGFSNTYGNFWLWDVHSTDAELESVYGSLYAVIGNCNFFLDTVDPVIASQTDDRKVGDLEDYKGQVLTIRAMCYSELVKCFCKAYDPATAAQTDGVMIRSKYFEEEPAVRASLEETYKFIVDDLTLAEELLNDEDEFNFANSEFITAAAAWALHARVALYMQDWQTAVDYSTRLIDEKSHLFRLASVNTMISSYYDEYFYMWAFDESPEVLWRINYTTSAFGGALGSVFLGYQRDFTYFYPDYVPASWALNLYGSNDWRYDSFFANSENGIVIGAPAGMDWPLLVKYYGNRQLMDTSFTTFCHMSMPKPLRLSEQYLIRAEAYCRQGDYTKATRDLNALRSKRLASGGAMSLTAENWLANISEERVRELFMEGFRLHDLKRWGLGFERTPQSNSLAEGSSIKIEAGDPLFVWPIPQHELDVPGSQITPNESNR